MEVNIAQTITANSQTVTASKYFPYNAIAQLRLNMQNQFDTINYSEGGIDGAIFQMLRPRYPNQMLNVLQQNTISNAYSAQGNLDTATNYTSASANLLFTLQIPVGLQFDRYWECGPTGRPVHRQPLTNVFVSPAAMSGSNRVVQPKVKYNPIFTSVSDGGLYTVSGGGTPATASGTSTLGITRYGFYQPVGPEDTPPMFNWQYTRESTRFTLAGVSKKKIDLPLAGQILLVFVRLFDPSASSNVGAPIAVTTLTKCQLLYGSGQIRFDDTPQRVQRRILEQRQLLLPDGVIAWDLAYQWGKVTNQYALNTMDTTGIQVNLEFSSTLSSTAYCVIGIEAMRYVASVG
jgi:hypothetical protein